MVQIHQSVISSKMKMRLILLLLVSTLSLSLFGCTQKQDGEKSVTYHNETYGFSLSIPENLLDHLLIPENPATKSVQFIYRGTDNNYTFSVEGFFFQIFAVPVDEKPATDGLLLLDQNETYQFYFWTPEDLDVAMSFEKAFRQYEDQIRNIPNSFVLDQP